jgi:hypothetical protein
MSMVGVRAMAHDFAVANDDGVTIYYLKTSDTEVAVSYQGSSFSDYSNEYTGNVVIPESVTYDGVTYSVTSIGEMAFSDCSGLTSLTIPNCVTSIGRSAFYGCSGLTSIIIGNSVTSIGNSAFYDCSGLTSVTVKIETPLVISWDTFSNQTNAILCVPYGSKAAYQAADYWKEFKEIVEIGDADGDGSIDVNDVTSTINHILNKPTASFFEGAADVDGDGTIDVNDVQGIIDRALGKIKPTEYYYYVGPDNPMEMSSISPVVTSQSEAGWYKIGTSIGTYSLDNPLLDASDNMIPMGSKTYDYVALPNSTLQVYNGLNISEMDAYTFLGTKVFDGVTYYIYQDKTPIRYFSQYIF